MRKRHEKEINPYLQEKRNQPDTKANRWRFLKKGKKGKKII